MRRWAAILAVAMVGLSNAVQAACNVALSAGDIDRVIAVALGSEYGTGTPLIAKWRDEVRVGVLGNPSAKDRVALDGIVADLGALIAPVKIRIDADNPNVRLHFAPEAEFKTILPQYIPTNMGFFWMWWDKTRTMIKAEVLISTTGLNQSERNHLMREELTQVLGLGNDLTDDALSIFYSEWTQTTRYTDSDTRVVRAVYCPDVVPFMDAGALRRTLEVSARRLSVAEVRELQQLLASHGHDIGTPDGVVGRKTRLAIETEQKSRGLWVDGVPNLGLLTALRGN